MAIIYFANDFKAENRTSSHHIAHALAEREFVLYAESPGMRAPQATGRDLMKIFKKLRSIVRKPHKVHDQLYVVTVFQLPFHGLPGVTKLNRHLVKWQIKRWIRMFSLSDPILWSLVPHLFFLPKLYPSLRSVYYVTDRYAAYPGADYESINRMDEQMSRDVDMIFVVSETLLEEKQRLNSNVVVSPHGVALDHFGQVLTRTLPIPDDVPTDGKPVMGYFGLMEDWTDIELLHYLATQLPNWNLVLVGRVATDISLIEALPNVYLLGAKPFSELPNYAATFSVAMLPYRYCEQVINSNPIKLREYLACGLPTVSIRFPQVEKFSSVVSIVENHADYADAVVELWENNSAELTQGRVDSVAQSGWPDRISNIINLLESNLRSAPHE